MCASVGTAATSPAVGTIQRAGNISIHIRFNVVSPRTCTSVITYWRVLFLYYTSMNKYIRPVANVHAAIYSHRIGRLSGDHRDLREVIGYFPYPNDYRLYGFVYTIFILAKEDGVFLNPIHDVVYIVLISRCLITERKLISHLASVEMVSACKMNVATMRSCITKWQ